MVDPTNPNRPPDWRWQLAKHLAETGERSPFRMDRYSVQAERFARRQLDCTTEAEGLQLAGDYAALFGAFWIYSDTSARVCRAVVEARLLAKQSDTEITE